MRTLRRKKTAEPATTPAENENETADETSADAAEAPEAPVEETEEAATEKAATEKVATEKAATEAAASEERTQAQGSREITLRLPTLAGMRRGLAKAGGALRRGGWVRGVWRRVPASLLCGLSLVILAGVAVATVWVVREQREAQAVADAKQEALVSAQQRVALLLSYDFSTIDDDIATANAQTTGSFHDDYAAVLEEYVISSATEQQIVNEASVSSAGVVEGDRNEVVVLTLVTQSTLQGEETEPTLRGYRLEVTMKRTGDDWLIAGFEPV